MIIALDYDQTFTEDRELWGIFVSVLKTRGHSVQFVTYRHPDWDNEDIEDDAERLKIGITYTAGRQKKHCFPEATIWIDDMPELCASYDAMKSMVKGCEVNGDTE